MTPKHKCWCGKPALHPLTNYCSQACEIMFHRVRHMLRQFKKDHPDWKDMPPEQKTAWFNQNKDRF